MGRIAAEACDLVRLKDVGLGARLCPLQQRRALSGWCWAAPGGCRARRTAVLPALNAQGHAKEAGEQQGRARAAQSPWQ